LAGKEQHSDPLSRLCNISQSKPFDNENYINQLIDYTVPTAVSLEEIARHSGKDEEILKVKKGIIDGVWSEEVSNYKILNLNYASRTLFY